MSNRERLINEKLGNWEILPKKAGFEKRSPREMVP